VRSETESERVGGGEDDKLLTLALWYLLTQFASVTGLQGTELLSVNVVNVIVDISAAMDRVRPGESDFC
jgi:hypothetical protein